MNLDVEYMVEATQDGGRLVVLCREPGHSPISVPVANFTSHGDAVLFKRYLERLKTAARPLRVPEETHAAG